MNQPSGTKLPFIWHHLAAVTGLGVFTLFLFWNILIEGHLLWGSDFIYAYLPYKQFLFNEIQQFGSIPLWNPYLFGGIPFWGFFESTIFYPFDIFFWFLPPERAYGYTMAVHAFMGGVFMYILCQTLRFSIWSSLLAALLFSCNGFFMPVLFLGRMVHAQSYVWTPLVLCLFVRALHAKRPFTAVIWAGISWGMQILAADPQTAFYTYLALLLFALVNDRTLWSLKGCLHTIKILVILFFVGIGLSAIQLVPSLELVSHATRGTLKSFDMVTLYSFPPEGIITILLPHFFGNLYENNFWIAHMPWSMPHYFLYVGILPWFLMFFLSFRSHSTRRLTLFCIILALISILLALGKHTPIYRLVYFLPGFNSFRGSSKIIVLWMLAFSILAGLGLDRFSSSGKLGKWGIAILFSSVFLCIFIDLWLFMDRSLSLRLFAGFLLKPISPDHLSRAAGIIASQFHRVVIFMMLVTLLWYAGHRGYLTRKTLMPLALLILLADLVQLNRLYIRPGDAAYKNLKDVRNQLSKVLDRGDEIFRVGGINSHTGPNDEMYYGFQTVTGAGPLIPYRYYRYINRFYGKVAPKGWQILYYGTPGSERFMDFLNVKYEIDYRSGSIRMRENYLPRVLLVPEYRVLPTSQVLTHMEGPRFNPKRTLLLEREPPFEKPGITGASGMTEGVGSCRILRYGPDEVRIRVHADHDGFLLLNDVYYPGWKCYVDGRSQEILRSNYLFRGTRVTKGKHDVRFVFKPLSVTLGIIVTLWTLLFSFLVIILEKRRGTKTSGIFSRPPTGLKTAGKC